MSKKPDLKLGGRPGKVCISAWIPEEVSQRLEEWAAREERSKSFIAKKILQKGVQHLDSEAGAHVSICEKNLPLGVLHPKQGKEVPHA